MAYNLRRHLPDIGLQNTLLLIDCFLPTEEFKSKHNYLKSFTTPKIIEYYYCSDCLEILEFENPSKEDTICLFCKREYNKSVLKENGQFFIYIPLEPQLIELVNSDIYTNFRKESDESDVINRKLYKKLRRNGTIKDNDISIQWNTDGVKLFITSKYGLWAIQVAINELPYRLRKNNIMLCVVFCNKKKPDMNMLQRCLLGGYG